eukprot:SRR837773.24342.p1 GENE.SRR837773.24342~~SRR837773.24342.p1  ORF type:complete len:349 (-),score=16.46 SRR837773.24342:1-936(-)
MEELRQHPNYVAPHEADLLFVDYDSIGQNLWPNYYKVAGCDWCSPESPDAYYHTITTFMKSRSESLPKHKVAKPIFFAFLSNVNHRACKENVQFQQQISGTALENIVFYVHFSLPVSEWNPRRDVSLLTPLKPDLTDLVTPVEKRQLCDRRPHLASFVGTRDHNLGVRNQIFDLMNIPRFNIHDAGQSRLNSTEYCSFLESSDFGLSPVGDEHYSFRLTEILGMASVPVIIDDGFTPPYGMADVNTWAVTVKESDIRKLPQILSAVSDEEFCAKRFGGVVIWDYAQSMTGTAQGMLVALTGVMAHAGVTDC